MAIFVAPEIILDIGRNEMLEKFHRGHSEQKHQKLIFKIENLK